MFSHYVKTHLEDFIEDVYLKAGILTPDQLTIDEVSYRLNIWVHYAKVSSRALESAQGMYSMFLDNRLTPMRQKLDFFHELCHLLRHAGNQMLMPRSFTQAQEYEADMFVMYATMPYFMLTELDIPTIHNDATNYISTMFNVPWQLAKRRVDQILRRHFEGKLMSRNTMNSYLEVNTKNQESLSSGSPRIYAYYDPTHYTDEPSQLLIYLDYWTLTSMGEYEIPLDEDFKKIELEDPQSHNFRPISPIDLVCGNESIKINIDRLTRKYGVHSQTFVLQMHDLKTLLNEVSNF
ncbi:ImmA/IrrE family metallo-endopeptidase [Paenibacillus campinasensis]|uniref:IrrE N-terminal-like domain-containing protein n=1 Tax=Paenibacillus campinasensis TaxID=66347 RepID=A0A268EKR2_9BACL|nr:ImmA/IrrE family metallo-endopeptidase [Paenibacillus campinasensis]PAD73702.1 hypothetical protein CHH67_19905 [Paenibacillus campinasensis]